MNRLRRTLSAVTIFVALAAIVAFLVFSRQPSTRETQNGPPDLPGSGSIQGSNGGSSGSTASVDLSSAAPTPDEWCAALTLAQRWLPAVSTEAAEVLADEWETAIQFATERLGASQDGEHKRVAAILAHEPARQIEYLESAVQKAGSNALVLWDAVRVCSESARETGCPLADWEARLQALDGQNSEVWIRIAANRLRSGNEEAALRAMQQAAVSPESREYWVESVEALERALSAAGNFTFPERVSAAFGSASSNLPDYQDYTSMCRNQAAGDVQWAYACLTYGELLERQGKTDIGHLFALALQKIALEYLGDTEKLAEVVARQDAFRSARQEAARSRAALSEVLLFANPSVLYDYLAEMRKLGEFSARAWLQEETERWLSLHGEPACRS
jgi:hypothetical protein